MTNHIVDHHIKQPKIHTLNYWNIQEYWTPFFYDHISAVLKKGGKIVDIGGGLRIDEKKGNSVNKKNQDVFLPILQDGNQEYIVTDYTDQYNPDQVEDIHNLTFADNSVDTLICLALLEHVYDPKKATEEMYRVLKPGGTLIAYAPFIYRYHAHETDYYDYFRYSKDGWAFLLRNFSTITLCPVRGLFESLLRFTPLHNIAIVKLFARALDTSCKRMRQISVLQTSGYHVIAVK